MRVPLQTLLSRPASDPWESYALLNGAVVQVVQRAGRTVVQVAVVRGEEVIAQIEDLCGVKLIREKNLWIGIL